MTLRRFVRLLLLPLLHACITVSPSLEGWSLLSYCDNVSVQVGSTGQCRLRIQNNARHSRAFLLNPIDQPTTCGTNPFALTTDRVILPATSSMYVIVTFSPTWYPEGGACEGKLTVVAEDDEQTYRPTTVLKGRVLDRDDDCDGISVGTGDCFDRSDAAWCAYVRARETSAPLPPPPPDPSGVPQPHEVHPAAIESCNGIDDDCDGLIDDEDDDREKQPDSRVLDADGQPYDPAAVLDGAPFLGALACYTDLDADSWPVPAPEPTWLCRDDQRDLICFDAPRTEGWDCNDEDRLFHPEAVERPGEPYDYDCDGFVTCFRDDDGDNYGGFNTRDPVTDELTIGTVPVRLTSGLPCETPTGDNIASQIGDCDDADGDIHPRAPEICDGLDNDCDGLIDDEDDSADEGSKTLWYADNDGDGFAGPDSLRRCASPGAQWLITSTDCDDRNFDVNPTATEICNGYDDDCVGGIDEQRDMLVFQRQYGPDEIGRYMWWVDGDRDGYGAAGTDPVYSCVNPGERVLNQEDCQDTREAVHPGAEELPTDGTDNNCDGEEACWFDGDGDGHGTITGALIYVPLGRDVCSSSANAALTRDDCLDDPANPLSIEVFPGQAELCNGYDDDCDGAIDQDDTFFQGGLTLYPDADGDGFGGLPRRRACAAEDGFLEGPADPAALDAWIDCDDGAPYIKPGAAEVPSDRLDNDCDGYVACYEDADRDGWAAVDAAGDAVRFLADLSIYGTDCDVIPGAATRLGDCDDTVILDASGQLLRPGALVHPGAVEVCNLVDDDCDGAVDDDDGDRVAVLYWYLDGDGDGAGDPNRSTQACDPPAAYVGNRDDCRDDSVAIHPGATELCNLLDDDCDGLTDDDDQLDGPVDLQGQPPLVNPAPFWYPDLDGDSFGDETVAGQQACAQPAGRYVADHTDCDDRDADVYLGARERALDGTDNDCDGSDLCFADLDADGFGDPAADLVGAPPGARPCETPGATAVDGDCDDDDALIHPGMREQCDDQHPSLDEDCDGLTEDEDPDRRLPAAPVGGVDPYAWGPDVDGDAFPDRTRRLRACDAPDGYLPVGDPTAAGDCDDGRADVFPGAGEPTSDILPPDGVDQDCDGDEACYADTDRDGFGAWVNDAARVLVPVRGELCAAPGASADLRDCDDNDRYTNPDAPESCTSGDENCNGLFEDEEPQTPYDAPTWYPDSDGDGDGDVRGLDTLRQCAQPFGAGPQPTHVLGHEDCNDRDTLINRQAVETCEPQDEDCDGLLNDNDPSVTGTTAWYPDADRDGFAPSVVDPSLIREQCLPPDGWGAPPAADRADCDDNDSSRHPDVFERPADGVDQDCDGLEACFCDRDGDGAGADGRYVFVANLACVVDPADPAAPAPLVGPVATCADATWYADNTADCDDADPANQTATSAWYADADGDGWGAGVGVLSCTPPAAVGGEVWVHSGGDCDDRAPTPTDPRGFDRNPDAVEVCNGADDDCDGVADPQTRWWLDRDGDGVGDPGVVLLSCEAPLRYVAEGIVDCDDADARVLPGAVDDCDGLDNDCDGLVDGGFTPTTWWLDTDGDGQGDATSSPELFCLPPTGYVASARDCDDSDPAVFDGAAELCNGVDDNCDGAIDIGAAGLTDWWPDVDEDGQGDAFTAPTSACLQPAGFVNNPTDCDDGAGAVFFGAIERCNSIDDNCVGGVDEDAEDAVAWWPDVDGDNAGDPSGEIVACPSELVGPHIEATGVEDCNDQDATISPRGTETCDAVDQDCVFGIDQDHTCGLDAFMRSGPERVYQVVTTPRSLSDAYGWCSARGYSLVRLETTAEAELVVGFAADVHGAITEVWTAYRYCAGEWRSSNDGRCPGEPLPTGEPLGAFGATPAGFVGATFRADGLGGYDMAAVVFSELRPFVCEAPAPP
jgi:hypothetical protein